MKDKPNETETTKSYIHLPVYAALKRYDASKWIIFGTLTHKYEVSPKVQLQRFRALMDQLGALNGAFGKRLHWAVRIEGAHEEEIGGTKVKEERTHMHFVLGAHKVSDGHKNKLTPTQVKAFLDAQWTYGRPDTKVYDDSKDGLGYVLKCNKGPNSPEWNDIVEISPALSKVLKREPSSVKLQARDPFAQEIVNVLKKRGAKIWFGDEAPRLQRSCG